MIVMILFFALILLIGCYVFYHVYRVIHMRRYKKTLCFVVTCLIFLLFCLFRVALGIFVHLLVGLVIGDLVTWVCHQTKYKVYVQTEVIALIIGSLLTGYGYYNMNCLQYTQYNIAVSKQCEEKRLLAVSDLHLSTGVCLDDLQEISQKAKVRKVDMIFILGDLFDEGTDESEAKEAIQFFDALAQDIPTYYVVGNHDGYQGRRSYQEGLLKALDESHVVFLKDDVIFTQGITLIGRLDESYQRQDTSTLLKGVDKSQPIILLDHQPKQISNNATLGIDLQISGHTHNGQVWPFGTLCRLLRINEVEYGHVLQDGMDVVVSSGMGSWGFPFKSQGKSEMVEINLKQG